MNRRFHVIVALLFLTGCATGLPQTLRQSLTVVVPHKVDFVEIEHYAVRSRAAYTPASQIRREFPQTTRVKTVTSIDVKYFVEIDQANKIQTITFRGTANKPNVWQDIEIALIKDSNLGVELHRGFRHDAQMVYSDLKPHLKKGYANRITGHSLGGAVAVIVAAYMQADGFDMERLVTFGQPKVTNDPRMHESNKTTRVVHDEDVVPMIPPTTLINGYRHFGPELVLRDGPDYVYLDFHNAERLSIGEFWRNISHLSAHEHFMKEYLANIREKVKNGSRQIPYYGATEAPQG